MTMISTSRPFAAKVPQSRAANNGSAVIVKPALGMRTLIRLSWLWATPRLMPISAKIAKICRVSIFTTAFGRSRSIRSYLRYGIL
jgi:hypothetical protein